MVLEQSLRATQESITYLYIINKQSKTQIKKIHQWFF